jgi:hypothetical protein
MATSLENLARYESAAIASSNVGKENDLAVAAMGDFYKGIYGEDFKDDVMIQRALKEAAVGGKDGITNSDLFVNIKTYTGKYEKAFISTKLAELKGYLLEGYLSDDELPEGFKKAWESYRELTIADLVEKGKDSETPKEEKEKINTYLGALEMLKSRRLMAKTLGIVNRMTKEGLNEMYPRQEQAH